MTGHVIPARFRPILLLIWLRKMYVSMSNMDNDDDNDDGDYDEDDADVDS